MSLSNFTGHSTTIDIAVWFPCDNESGYALGLGGVGNRDLEILGNKRNYNILLGKRMFEERDSQKGKLKQTNYPTMPIQQGMAFLLLNRICSLVILFSTLFRIILYNVCR